MLSEAALSANLARCMRNFGGEVSTLDGVILKGWVEYEESLSESPEGNPVPQKEPIYYSNSRQEPKTLLIYKRIQQEVSQVTDENGLYRHVLVESANNLPDNARLLERGNNLIFVSVGVAHVAVHKDLIEDALAMAKASSDAGAYRGGYLPTGTRFVLCLDTGGDMTPDECHYHTEGDLNVHTLSILSQDAEMRLWIEQGLLPSVTQLTDRLYRVNRSQGGGVAAIYALLEDIPAAAAALANSRILSDLLTEETMTFRWVFASDTDTSEPALFGLFFDGHQGIATINTPSVSVIENWVASGLRPSGALPEGFFYLNDMSSVVIGTATSGRTISVATNRLNDAEGAIVQGDGNAVAEFLAGRQTPRWLWCEPDVFLGEGGVRCITGGHGIAVQIIDFTGTNIRNVSNDWILRGIR